METKTDLKSILETQDLSPMGLDDLIAKSDEYTSGIDDLTEFIIKTYNKMDTDDEISSFISYSINELKNLLKVIE
jgi:uncharacterized phage infection (PIP) family protein YhgE